MQFKLRSSRPYWNKPTPYMVNRSPFTRGNREIVKCWYEWQAAWLKSMGERPGEHRQAWGHPDNTYWGAPIPQVKSNNELQLYIGGDMYYLSINGDRWQVDVTADLTGSGRRYCASFASVNDAHKYLLLKIGQTITAQFGGDGSRVLDVWASRGLAPGTELRDVHPGQAPHSALAGAVTVALAVTGEQSPRCEMLRADAVLFSHVLGMTFGRLNRVLRSGSGDIFDASIVLA